MSLIGTPPTVPFGVPESYNFLQKNALVLTLNYNVISAEHFPLNKSSPQIIHKVKAAHTVILQLRYFLVYQIQMFSHSLFEFEHNTTGSLMTFRVDHFVPCHLQDLLQGHPASYHLLGPVHHGPFHVQL
jgi:hypothetical protein